MKWDTQVFADDQQSYSSVENLANYEQGIPPYAYCLPRYAKLDGTYENAPDEITQGGKGYISASLSDQNGAFETAPMITITFDRLKTSNGLLIVGNRASGDYASEVKICWYKDGEVVAEQEFSPTSVEYLCQKKVPLFNKIEVSFLKTSKPYRYLWISELLNRKMTDAGGLKIVYDDIALGASEDSTASADDKETYVDMQDLVEGVEYPNYAMCLRRYSKLNGEYENAPDGDLKDMGYVSKKISNVYGSFTTAPVITFLFTQTYSSVGITLHFNTHSGDYCSLLNIKWYRDDELLKDQDYEPDSVDYFCYGIVDYYNKVVITFKKTSKPYRKLFLSAVTWGLIRTFKDDEIEDIDVLMETSPISEEVTINTMSYTLRSKTAYEFEFQKKQKQTLYFDESVLGIFYLKDGKQLGATRYSVETQDVVGILDSNPFMGGMYKSEKVSELLDAIMEGESTEYFLDDAYKDITVSGYLPICTKREALQQLAFAIGAVVNTAYDRQLYIYPQTTEVSGEFTPRDVRQGLTVNHSDIVTGIRLYAHSYTPSTESSQLYKAVLDRTVKVEFSEPQHSLEITGGLLGESDVNYAYIIGNGGEVTLTGLKYNHNTVAFLKENPKVSKNKNIAEVKEATLVTAENAPEVLERVYAFYENNESVNFTATIDTQELGDRVSVATGFKGTMEGTITKMNYKFSRRKMTAEVVIE